VVGEVTYGSSEGIYGDIFLYGNWSEQVIVQLTDLAVLFISRIRLCPRDRLLKHVLDRKSSASHQPSSSPPSSGSSSRSEGCTLGRPEASLKIQCGLSQKFELSIPQRDDETIANVVEGAINAVEAQIGYYCHPFYQEADMLPCSPFLRIFFPFGRLHLRPPGGILEDTVWIITTIAEVAREPVRLLIEWMAIIADLSFYRVDSALYNIGNHLIVPLRNG